MTASQKIVQKLVHMVTGERHDDMEALAAAEAKSREIDDGDAWSEAEGELRSGTDSTGLAADYCRHYESRAVAAQMLDGSFVGWTYWFGGGKHGQSSEMAWIEDAYDVTMEVAMKPVREFRRTDDPGEA